MDHISKALHAIADGEVNETIAAAAVILVSAGGKYILLDVSPPDNGERALMLAEAITDVASKILGEEDEACDFTASTPGIMRIH